MRIRRGNFAAAVLAVLAITGCAQTAKRTLPDGIRTIYIREFTNKTDQMALSAILLEEIRREFRLDGRLTVLDSSQGADSELDGKAVEYARQPARFDRNNVVQEYRLRLIIDCSLRDVAKGETLFQEKGPESSATPGASTRKLERYTNYVVVPASGMMAETEQDAQRRIARDLARDLVLKVIEGW